VRLPNVSRVGHLADDDGEERGAEDGEAENEGDEELEENWEIGALAWGIITATGLGAGSASVFGAEVVAR